MEVYPDQGANGRWRWVAYTGRKFECIGKPYGHRDEESALRDARRVLGQSVTIEAPDGELFAAGREFDHQ